MAFFKYVYNDDGSQDHTDALYGYCSSFDPSTTFEKVKPILIESDETHIRQVIGDDFYDELQAAYDADTMSAAQIAIILLLRKASAFFCYAEASKSFATQLSDLGPTEVIDSEGPSSAPRQWVQASAISTAFKKGHRRLEDALKYLEKHADNYPTWQSSDAFTRNYELFFRSGGELADFLPLDNCARIAYLRMRPGIQEAERRYIRPVIGAELFAELKSAIKLDELSELQKEAVYYIRWALSKWAVRCALPFLRLEISTSGLIEPGFDNGINKKPAASEPAVQSMWVSAQEAGEAFLFELKTFLDANADNFPTYKASHQYQEGKGSEGFMSQKDDDGKPYNIISLL